MPKDMILDGKIAAVAGKPVMLPNGDFAAHADMTRTGLDLHLTSHGHTIIVENYFAQQPAPDLVTHDGARLTPALVDSFLPPEHAGQYAASGQTANDASPIGKITEVSGEATIIHADGTHIPAAVNAEIHQGDVIETSKTGAVNILFADNTTFAISESARLSVDQFVYDSAHHSGSTFFSMLQGVFVYTSGLIGKSDPGSVSIETPVGSIGIRGTVVAGHIMPAGEQSTITILDGAIAVTNAAGTQEMHDNFNTIALNSYQSAATDLGQIDVHTFNSTYQTLSGVAHDTVEHFSAIAPSTTIPPHDAPTGDQPHDNTTVPQDGQAQPPADSTQPPSGSDATKTAVPPPPPPAPVQMNEALPPPPPPPGSSFGDPTQTTSNFTAPPPPPPPGSTSFSDPGLPPPPPPPSGTGTTTQSGGTPFTLHFDGFSFPYLNNKFGVGVGEFADEGTVVGHFTPINGTPISYDYYLKSPDFQQATPGVPAGQTNLTGNPFIINGQGELVVNNTLALSHFLNQNGIDITIKATDGSGHITTFDQHIDIKNYMSSLISLTQLQVSTSGDLNPLVPGSGDPNYLVGDGNLMGDTGDDVLIGHGTDPINLFGAGGADIIIGNKGDNLIGVTGATSGPNFTFIDGGAGVDTLSFGNSGTPYTVDFTAGANRVINIEKISLGGTGTQGNNIVLNLQSVFDMAGPGHQLDIAQTTANRNSNVYLNMAGWTLQAGGSPNDATYTGSVNNQEVTLVIHKDIVGQGHINII